MEMERLSQLTDRDVHSVEERLSEIADQYAESLKRWAGTVERHARAITQLEAHLSEWKEAGARVQEDASHRLNDLETVVQREWDAIRDIHEAPVKQLQQQASSLTQVCIETASAAQQGFDRAEARLSSFEDEFHHRMSDLTREVQSAVAEMRARAAYPAPGVHAGAQWSLNDVTRLHSQLREGGTNSEGADHALEASATLTVAQAREIMGLLPPSSSAATEVHDNATPAAVRNEAIPRNWRIAIVCLAVIVALAGLGVWRLQGQLNAAAAQVADAERRSERAREDAARQAQTSREEAAREISNARDLANRAQLIGYVLAAPDLMRFNLYGAGALRGATAQALWSRSRGLVFSGNRIPAPPANAAYQAWLVTRAGPVNAGTWIPDAGGTVTIARDAPVIPRAVIGVMVTLEGASGSDKPSSGPVLISPLPTE